LSLLEPAVDGANTVTQCIRRLGVVSLLLLLPAWAGEIRGTIVNARGGEPLGQVRVGIVDTRTVVATAPDGTFSIKNLAPGTYVLRVDAVGFWLQKTVVTINDDADVKEYSIALVAEGLRPTETVDVTGDNFHPVEMAGVGDINVTADELRSTASVVSADPFRTVQVLPGVTSASNNDSFAEFNVLGAPFSTVGIYVDDVQIRNPMHGIPGFADGASISILSSDTIDALTLTPTAFSERYADSTGAALDIRTREGARNRPLFRFSPGMLEAHGTGEGGFAHKRGSWLVALRKSYLGSIAAVTELDVPSIGFYDGSVKLTYDLNPEHTLDLYAVHGSVSMDRTHQQDEDLGPNSLAFGKNITSLARLGWRYAVTPRFLLSSRAAFISEKLQTHNPSFQPLTGNKYGEWVGGTTAVWSWSPDHLIEAGYDLRRLRSSQQNNAYYLDTYNPNTIAEGTGLRQGGYAQQSSTLLGKRVHLTAGLRWDRLRYVGTQPLSPQASASVRVGSATDLQFAFGKYLQFSDVSNFGRQYDSQLPTQLGLTWYCWGSATLYSRGTHYLGAVEQRLSEHSRLRVEAFHREEGYVRGERPRIHGTCSSPFDPKESEYGSWHQRSRGLQLVLQRRSANRLAGWIGYTLNHVRNIVTPGVKQYPDSFYNYPVPLDQRHTVNAVASYRLKPTVSLSGKWMYGSGYPIPAWLRKSGSDYFWSEEPTYVRMPSYARLDVRMDKTFALKSRKLTLSVEVLNATNHRNMRLMGYDNYDPETKRVFVSMDRTIPLAPTAGLTFEF